MLFKFPKIREVATVFANNFRLRKHEPRLTTLQILKTLYPAVNWNRVDFYEGLPWFTPSIAPYVTAQALPNFYSLNRFRIYLKKYDESRAQCLADIVHEAFHINQGMRFAKGYGLGFFRIWMVYYIAVFFKKGYRQNDFEIPAFNQEFAFLSFCQEHGLHGIQPALPPELPTLAGERKLVHTHIDFHYQEGILRLIGAFFLCLLIAVIKPFADFLVWICGSLLRKKPVS